MTDAQVYTGAAVMGVAAGMRSMSSPAILSQLAKSGLAPVGHSSIGFLNHPATARTMAVLAAGELIADKLPFLPKRTQAPALITRVISGGLSGAAVCSAKKRSIWLGALFGALGAVGATYGAYRLRKWTGEKFHIPDPVVAVVEDAIVAGCGMMVAAALSPEPKEA